MKLRAITVTPLKQTNFRDPLVGGWVVVGGVGGANETARYRPNAA